MGLSGGEAGDRVHGHGTPAAAAQGADPAGDPERLGGVGEVQAGDGGDLQAANLGAAVAAVAGVVGNGDSGHGRVVSWWCRLGWLALTISR